MNELIQAYGEDFVRYVLALSVDADLSTIQLTPEQQSAVALLTPHAQRVIGEQNPFLRNQMTRGEIVSAMTADSKPLLTEIRKTCGGELPQPEGTDDAIYKLLHEMVVDAYPALLLRIEVDFNGVRLDWSYLSSLTFHHQKGDELCAELLKDEATKLLFPGAPDPADIIGDKTKLIEVQSNISWSDGSGGSFQLCMLPQVLIAAVFRRAILKGDRSITAVVTQISDVLHEVRQLAKGKTVKVPTVIGLGNIKVAEGIEVEVYGGKIRAAAEADKQWSLWRPDNAQDIHAVLETRTALKVVRKSTWRPGKVSDPTELQKQFEAQRPAIEKAHKDNQQNINLSCFCLLLASKGKNLITAKEMTKTVYNPLALMTPNSWRRDNFAVYPEVTIDASIAADITTWATAVKNNFPDSMDLGMRRLLGATTSRFDPLDSFVDAVICWENAFGTNEGEVSFRVCGAIARVLEPDDKAKRARLFTELRDLYTARSKLVHGGKEPDTTTAYNHRDRAIEVGVELMKKIVTTKDLYDAASSSVRSKAVLLDLA